MTVAGRRQAYAAGNKTYGFGRSNPTNGPVDPLGYKERNLMQAAIGRALANPVQATQQFAAANGQTIGSPNVAPNAPGGASFVGSSTLVPSPTGAMMPDPNAAPQVLSDPVANVGQNTPQTIAGATPSPEPSLGTISSAPPGYIDPAQPPPAPVKFTTGQGMVEQTPPPVPVQQAPAPNPAQTLSPEQSSQQLGQGGPGTGSFMPDYAQRQHDIETNAYQQQRQIQDSAPAAYKHLTDVYAGRGLVHSGRYADDFGAAQNQTAAQLSQLDQTKAQLLAQLTGQNTDWNAQQAALQQQNFMNQLQSQIGQAGSLGIDGTAPPPAPDYASLLQQLISGYGQAQNIPDNGGATVGPTGFSATPAPSVHSNAPRATTPKPSAPRVPAKTTVKVPAKTPTSTRKATPVVKAPIRRPGPIAGAKAPRPRTK